MIDVITQINAVRRRVGTRTLEAGEARTVIVSQAYDADQDDLWDACTNPERLPRWFLPVSGDLRLGGRYQLEGNAGGTIERCDPPKSFAATWEFGGQTTWIEVRLTPEDQGGTRLELEHIAHIDDHWTQFGPGAVGIGWDLTLLGLATHLATGEPNNAQEFMTWTTSAEGKDFMTRSSESWYTADVASGTPEPTARATTTATITAYTGS